MNPHYELVALRAGHRCEYCHAPEALCNFPFEVEHIVAPQRATDAQLRAGFRFSRALLEVKERVLTIDGWMAVLYWAVSLVASGLYGWKAVAIFLPPLGEGDDQAPMRGGGIR